MRIGTGYDVHVFCEGRPLILGGVQIPFSRGLLGHSDADVLVHAIMDAVLGAMACGDIGQLFPDTDIQYQSANSMLLLETVVALMREKQYALVNLDTTIVAEQPKLSAYLAEMQKRIAYVFGCATDRISIKATTEEGLGLAGKGIGVHAVCLLDTAI